MKQNSTRNQSLNQNQNQSQNPNRFCFQFTPSLSFPSLSTAFRVRGATVALGTTIALVATVALLAVVVPAASAFGDEVTRWGAKITKAQFGETEAPQLLLPEGWRLLEGEKFTGLNPREYYFTIESDGKNLPAPEISVSWPNVAVSNVYGAQWLNRNESGALKLRPTARRTPTGFTTVLPKFGAVSMGVFHNVEGLQAGEYRGLPYPKNEIQAHLNYLFAAREMMREMGFTDSPDAVKGVVNLYGFETNFPNGHVDYPPHFHVMLMWNSWQDNHFCHYILNEKGKIIHNSVQVMENGVTIKEKTGVQPLGSTMVFPDATGNIRFSIHLLEDGSGVEMSVPGKKKQAMIRSDDSIRSVSCFVREAQESPWIFATETNVKDDSREGILEVETKESDGNVRKEVWRYDPNSGGLKQ